MQEYITKKELLEQMNISYGQLYRWKRMGLIPENWFIKRPSSTGQETILPRRKIVKRIQDIQEMMASHSLEQIVARYAFSPRSDVIDFESLYKSKHLTAEYVSALGNYFKKPGYTAIEYMMIICCADVARKERYTTRQYVDLLRYALPVAQKCEKVETRCIFFAAGGDYHIALLDNTANITFDMGLRTMGDYNFETMWDRLKEEF
ncbi:MAG: DUF4004 family protein [Oscillospiraceae bacterium]|nr:DUF4004 family protein [Oscillospiraceae bacterium]